MFFQAIPQLAPLGWDDWFAEHFGPFAAEGFVSARVVADMPGGTDHLPPTLWVGASITLEVEHYRCAVLGFDEALEVHRICVVGATPWVVGAAKAS